MTDRPGAPELAITFFYYHDLDAAFAFYTDVMGFPLAIDQGWSKILRMADGAHVGLVDQSHRMNKATPDKPVQLCIRVADVDAWFVYAQSRNVANLSKLFQNDGLGIRAFVFHDPEGYQIEVQSATRPGT